MRWCVRGFVALHALTLVVFLWAMAVEGSALLTCLTVFME